MAACRRGARTSTCCPAEGKILLGLQRSSGSNTARTLSMTLRSSGVKINGISATFSTPMPCSPVRLPPRATHSRRISRPAATTLSVCSRSRSS